MHKLFSDFGVMITRMSDESRFPNTTTVSRTPTVSVILPTYNRANLLPRAIDSVLGQTYSDFELLIIDDASDDNTREVVQQYDDRRIRYIRKECNEGGGAARNRGIEASNGEYVAFLDSDDEWLPTKLKKQVDRVTQMGDEYSVVYCLHYVAKDEYDALIEDAFPLHHGDVYEELLSGWCPASTSLFLVQKSALEHVGVFDPNLPSFQDYDLWIRLAKEYSFSGIDERLAIKHRHGGKQLSTSLESRSKGLEMFLEKWAETIKEEFGNGGLEPIWRRFLSDVHHNLFIEKMKGCGFFRRVKLLRQYPVAELRRLTHKQALQLLILVVAGERGLNLTKSIYYRLSFAY